MSPQPSAFSLVTRCDGMIHGDLAYRDEVAAARRALAEIGDELREPFRRPCQ